MENKILRGNIGCKEERLSWNIKIGWGVENGYLLGFWMIINVYKGDWSKKGNSVDKI